MYLRRTSLYCLSICSNITVNDKICIIMNITDEQKKKFDRYYELLIEWNQKINLTAITDRDEVWLKHFEDSLSIERIMDMTSIDAVIDVGTGAGFPGIPLKIAYPHLKITLLDSLDKRLRFLDKVVRELNLSDVTMIHGRAEDYGRDPDHREKYDLCVSRAVASLPVLSELCIPFVRIGGCFVAYKSEKAEVELNDSDRAISLLGARIGSMEQFSLSDGELNRILIKIDKLVPTPDKYPRRAGVPSKKPLG